MLIDLRNSELGDDCGFDHEHWRLHLLHACGNSNREQVRELVELMIECIVAHDGFCRDEPGGHWWARESRRLMAASVLEATRRIAWMREDVSLIETCAEILGGVWANKLVGLVSWYADGYKEFAIRMVCRDWRAIKYVHPLQTDACREIQVAAIKGNPWAIRYVTPRTRKWNEDQIALWNQDARIAARNRWVMPVLEKHYDRITHPERFEPFRYHWYYALTVLGRLDVASAAKRCIVEFVDVFEQEVARLGATRA